MMSNKTKWNKIKHNITWRSEVRWNKTKWNDQVPKPLIELVRRSQLKMSCRQFGVHEVTLPARIFNSCSNSIISSSSIKEFDGDNADCVVLFSYEMTEKKWSKLVEGVPEVPLSPSSIWIKLQLSVLHFYSLFPFDLSLSHFPD